MIDTLQDVAQDIAQSAEKNTVGEIAQSQVSKEAKVLTHNGGTSEPITDPARLLAYKNDSNLTSSVGGNDAKVVESSSSPVGTGSVLADRSVADTGTVLVEDVVPNTERLLSGTSGQVTGGSSTKLGNSLNEAMGRNRSDSWSGYQAQHLIPSELKSHPNYTEAVRQSLNNMDRNLPVDQLQKQVYDLQVKFRNVTELGMPVRNVDGAKTDVWLKWINK